MSKTTVLGAAALAGAGFLALKRLEDEHAVLKDVRLLAGLSKLGAEIQYNLLTNWTVADGVELAAARHPGRAALVFRDEVHSFNDWEARANQAARFFHQLGVRCGDVVAIYMTNRPEFIFAWCGLAKLGACGALLNNQLVKAGLRHCLDVSGATHVLIGAECVGSFEDQADALREAGYKLHVEGAQTDGAASWTEARTERFRGFSTAPTPRAWREGRGFGDPALLIFTSGTTGLPKAAVLKHAKLFGAGRAYATHFGIKPDDVIYNAGLPLYHSAATNIGVGLSLVQGCTLVLRDKFSATHFFEDCARYECTVVQYIGELCRYLLASPQSSHDRAHAVRLAVGNGLRPEIWAEFQQRFGIREIGEFYGASEGNLALFNHATTPRARGAVGHMGLLFRQLGFCTILRYDAATEQLVRDPATGSCVEAAIGEVGEGVAEIKDRVAGSFDGYHGSPEQTDKKILRNVFREGDAYFRSGDLLKRDAQGYYYFVDRIGDTFRWKAENVATTEVAAVVGKTAGVRQCAIYGAQLPNMDGRALVAALVLDDPSVHVQGVLADLAKRCADALPVYARPLFVRLLPALDATGTMKIVTVQLKHEGVDPTVVVSDPLFVWDSSASAFKPLDAERWSTIVTGASRL